MASAPLRLLMRTIAVPAGPPVPAERDASQAIAAISVPLDNQCAVQGEHVSIRILISITADSADSFAAVGRSAPTAFVPISHVQLTRLPVQPRMGQSVSIP